MRYSKRLRAERDERIRELHRRGLSYRDIGDRVGCSHMAVKRALSRPVPEPDDDELDDVVDDDESDDEGEYIAELLDELYMPDGRPNRLTIYRLQYGINGPLTREQLRRLNLAQDIENRRMH